VRAQRGTKISSHASGNRIYRLVEQTNATYVFPSPITGTDTALNLAEFSASIKENDILRLNKINLDEGGEYVRVTQINPANAQTFTINNGDFGNEAISKNPLEVFKTITTTGNTQIVGDVVIGYDTNRPFINPTVSNECIFLILISSRCFKYLFLTSSYSIIIGNS
jgi:hypothetical protein